MTLKDIELPVDVDWSRNQTLIFSSEIAQRINEIQSTISNSFYRLEPKLLSDGRYMVSAFILTECIPGGFLYPAFSMLDHNRFHEIEIIPLSEALSLFPPISE